MTKRDPITATEREAIEDAIYTQLCEEIRSLNMFEMLAAKDAWGKRKPLAQNPNAVKLAIFRVTTAALSKIA